MYSTVWVYWYLFIVIITSCYVQYLFPDIVLLHGGWHEQTASTSLLCPYFSFTVTFSFFSSLTLHITYLRPVLLYCQFLSHNLLTLYIYRYLFVCIHVYILLFISVTVDKSELELEAWKPPNTTSSFFHLTSTSPSYNARSSCLHSRNMTYPTFLIFPSRQV